MIDSIHRRTITNNTVYSNILIEDDINTTNNTVYIINGNYIDGSLYASAGGGNAFQGSLMVIGNRITEDLEIKGSDGMVGSNHVSGSGLIYTTEGVVNQGTNTPSGSITNL